MRSIKKNEELNIIFDKELDILVYEGSKIFNLLSQAEIITFFTLLDKIIISIVDLGEILGRDQTTVRNITKSLEGKNLLIRKWDFDKYGDYEQKLKEKFDRKFSIDRQGKISVSNVFKKKELGFGTFIFLILFYTHLGFSGNQTFCFL